MSVAVGDGLGATGLSTDELEIVRGILQRHVPQHDVWAFGSRARGTARPCSDLDLVVMTNTVLSLDTVAELKEAFSESDLPWKVDVVDWSTTSEAFRNIIGKDKLPIQKGSH